MVLAVRGGVAGRKGRSGRPRRPPRPRRGARAGSRGAGSRPPPSARQRPAPAARRPVRRRRPPGRSARPRRTPAASRRPARRSSPTAACRASGPGSRDFPRHRGTAAPAAPPRRLGRRRAPAAAARRAGTAAAWRRRRPAPWCRSSGAPVPGPPRPAGRCHGHSRLRSRSPRTAPARRTGSPYAGRRRQRAGRGRGARGPSPAATRHATHHALALLHCLSESRWRADKSFLNAAVRPRTHRSRPGTQEGRTPRGMRPSRPWLTGEGQPPA